MALSRHHTLMYGPHSEIRQHCCLTSTRSAEPQRAATGAQRGVDGVPAARRLTGRGVRIRALPVRLALVLVHPQRRHGQLLPAQQQQK